MSAGIEAVSQATQAESVDREVIAEHLAEVMIPGRAFALRLSANEADADDLLQEAAVRACRFFHQFTPGTNFRAWFYTILTNCFYRSVRSERRRGRQVALDEAPSLPQLVDPQAPDPARALLSRLDSKEIVDAVDDLPHHFRRVALLYFIEDRSYDQIAQILGVPVGTVRSRLHRARRILQRDLWRVAAEHGLVHRN